ncbi:MAG: 2Fe-2S iron-sulfur cluster-binding protein [Acidobacteriota bacterium]|nr:2Fe-2S iron-sulfur cluster-binding protein [Acidobacteriota bacterium]
MLKFTIDGEELEVAPGTTILEAALSRGREVPHYCYHPGLSISGNCRMCLVEVEKMPKLVIACATPVADNMVVHTQNDRVKAAQASIMEFLLVNHPLDCPICDQAGECRLQEYAVDYGTGISRSIEPKVQQSKAVDLGKHILLDQERCIQCSRCIRFCDEISGTGELAFFQRGERTIIGTYPGQRLDNPYSGNTADICPVGALTVKEFRFKTRVWYLENTPSVCAGCSRGCNVMVATGKQEKLWTTRGQFGSGIKRVVPRANMDVNAHWICDEGRLSYRTVEDSDRMLKAQAPAESAIDWDEGVQKVAAALKSAGDRAAVLFSPRHTNETYYAWKRLLDAMGIERVGVRSLRRGEDDKLLIRADKGANSLGAGWVLGEQATEARVLDAVRDGHVDLLVTVGDPLDPADDVNDADLSSLNVKQRIHVGPFQRSTAGATISLPAPPWSEEDGTMTNFEGRVQRVRRARVPRGEARPAWRLVADLAEAASVEFPSWGSAADVLVTLSENCKPFEGLDEEAVGLLGVASAATAPAGS